MAFACDEAKQHANIRKHGIDLREAGEIFFSPQTYTRYDPEHSEQEDRYGAVGMTSKGKLLYVSFTLRMDRIRLISARKASNLEVREYANQYK